MIGFYLSLIDTEEKSKMGKLYYTYKELMLKVSYSVLKDSDLANDALHEAFIKIARSIKKLDEVCSPATRSYVVITIENVSKTMYNKRKREESVSLDELEYEISDNVNDRIEASDELDVQYIYEKIKLLPDIYSEILTLKCANELSDKEIAQTLNISNAAARKRLERARLKLNELLGKGWNK